MQKIKYSVIVTLLVFLAGCGITGRVSEMQAEADSALEREDHETALRYYEEIIELHEGRGREVDGMIWHNAGLAAWETGNNDKTVDYLRTAHRRGQSSEESYYTLSLAYREIDNLSLEITNLEGYVENYPSGEYVDEVRMRLFETYVESNNVGGAMALWPLIEDHAADNPRLLEGYMTLNRRQGNENDMEDIAKQLLEADPDNKTALVYLAEKYFWEAENRYQAEMQAYEREQTRRQYRQLLEALDEINAQFRQSRDYFEKLYKDDPLPAYAQYLSNIYTRFGDDERAAFYRRRAN